MLEKGIAMEPMFQPNDESCYQRDNASCYQCGHQWQSILLNGGSIVCLGCGTVNQLETRYTPTGTAKVSRRQGKEKRKALKLQKFRRYARQRQREKRLAVKLILCGLLPAVATYLIDLGGFGLPIFWIGTTCFFVGMLSLAYLRSIQ